jgi:hypothetical protein
MPVKEYLTQAFNEKPGSSSSTNNINGADFFQITKTKMEYLSLGETQLSVHFLVFNPYGMVLKLNSFPITLKLNGNYAGKANLREPLVLNEDIFKTEGDVIITVDNWKTISTGLKSALTQELTYDCLGKLYFNIAGVDLSKPIAFNGKVELNPFRKNGSK